MIEFIKPCSKCDTKNPLIMGGGHQFYIQCRNYPFCPPDNKNWIQTYSTVESAIDAWNTRHES
jgi:hypothetical protein